MSSLSQRLRKLDETALNVIPLKKCETICVLSSIACMGIPLTQFSLSMYCFLSNLIQQENSFSFNEPKNNYRYPERVCLRLQFINYLFLTLLPKSVHTVNETRVMQNDPNTVESPVDELSRLRRSD